MSANDKVAVGIIGTGNIGKAHLHGLTRTEGAEVTAVTDVYLPLAEERAREYNVGKVHRNAEELINDPSIDAVVIGVPNKFHAPLAIQALQAGKHVLLEKPMAINAASAKDIVRAQQASGKTLMIGHQMRFEWVAQQVKEQAEKGAFGNIYNAKACWFRRKGIPGWGTWFTQNELSGGGPLIDIGVHMLDLSLHLMGNPKPVSVFGSTYAEFGPKKRGIGAWGTPNWNGFYDVEDLATALIKLENGATLTLEVSWAAHTDDNNPFVTLMGSEGGASVRGKNGKLMKEIYDRTVDIDLKTPDNDEGGRPRLHRHFVECVRDGKQPLTHAMSGLANNLILEAIYESSRTGQLITLDWNL